MKQLQFVSILFILLVLISCDKYNDELLTDIEVEDYGYILPEMEDEYENYPLSNMNYTHSLNLYIPLVYEGFYEGKLVHIKGLLYNDVLTKEWQSKRIKVTSIEKMESLPFGYIGRNDIKMDKVTIKHLKGIHRSVYINPPIY